MRWLLALVLLAGTLVACTEPPGAGSQAPPAAPAAPAASQAAPPGY